MVVSTNRVRALQFLEERLDVSLLDTASHETDAAVRRNSRVDGKLMPVSLSGNWTEIDRFSQGFLLGPDDAPRVIYRNAAGLLSSFDPETERTKILSTAEAGTITGVAEVVSRQLPHPPVTTGTLVSFLSYGSLGNLLLLIVLGLAAALLGILTPVVTAIVFEEIIPEKNIPHLLILAAGLAGISGMLALLEYGRWLVLNKGILRVDHDLTIAIYSRLLSASSRFLRGFSAADLSLRLMDVSTLRQMIGPKLVMSIVGVGFAVVNVGYMLWVDIQLGLGSILITVVLAIAIGSLMRKHVLLDEEETSTEAGISAFLTQVFQNLTMFRQMGRDDDLFSHWREENDRLIVNINCTLRSLAFIHALQSGFVLIAPGVIFLLLMTVAMSVPLASFLAFFAAFGQFLFAILVLIDVGVSILRLAAPYRRLKPILDHQAHHSTEIQAPFSSDDVIEVRDLKFTYDEGEGVVLNDLTFRQSNGEVLAITGPSGSGKSTLASILMGMESGATGTIAIARDHQIGISDRQLQERVIGVLQGGPRLAGKLQDIVCAGRSITAQRINEVASALGVSKLLHSEIADVADTLSPSDAQMVRIMQAILASPTLLILDEATTELGEENLQRLVAALKEMKLSTLVLTHQRSVLQRADRVLLLDGGRVHAEGTFEHLMITSKVFNRYMHTI